MALANLFRRGKTAQFQEIEEYRDLIETPTQFEDGFNLKTIVGALFVSIVMVPGNIYLELMIGGSIGAAAQWVTIILFLELAKRSFTTLKRQEIYLLYYVTTSLINRESGAFEGLLWNQYFVQSPAAKQFGISKLIPLWYAPPIDSTAFVERTFFHEDWFLPIALLVLGMIMGRIAWFSASYVLFRLTSDYEKLPFPFAPINAQGAMALAEESSGEFTWKWRVFSVGAVIGVLWGTIYVAVPAISGAFMERPIQLIPIPWVDFTPYTGYFLPATPLGFTLHQGPILAGMLAPFWAVVGSFLGVLVHTIASPILHHYRSGCEGPRLRAVVGNHLLLHELRRNGSSTECTCSTPDAPVDLSDAIAAGLPSAPVLIGPSDGIRVGSPNPRMTIGGALAPQGRDLIYQFEVDKVPSFDGSFLQSSDDRPILFDALKPKIMGVAFIAGVSIFVLLSIFGLPILLVFGYIQSLTQIPHVLVTQIIGALLARFYFWKKYGRQQWRLYAAVLVVGFSVGMALVGMASVSIAMIQKSVSVLLF